MTSKPRIFLLRHGESTANVEGVIVSAAAVAERAYGLTERGRTQVLASVTAAREQGVLPAGTRILASPFLRAVESAEIAAAALGTPFDVDARLAERRFGSLDLTSDAGYAGVWARDAANPSHEEWGVESVTSVLRRASALVGELERAARSPAATCEARTRHVLLCTHGDVASVLLCAAAGEPLGRHREVGALANAEIRELVRGGARSGERPRGAAREQRA